MIVIASETVEQSTNCTLWFLWDEHWTKVLN